MTLQRCAARATLPHLLLLALCSAATLGARLGKGYGYGGLLAQLRSPGGDMSHLDKGRHSFLDYAGTGLYTKHQARPPSGIAGNAAQTLCTALLSRSCPPQKC